MNSVFHCHTLPNGLRVFMEVMPDVLSAAAGFFARTGGRDETPDLAGVSHFLEHMCFKGTSGRTWREINVAFDDMGSTYNAYTMKDRTFYYGWVPRARIGEQIELLSDMMRSTLSEDEFAMEKNVILEEIAMSQDQLENLAYEFMHEQIFAGHPLAWPVLGYEQTVREMTRQQMYDYFVRRYAPDNLTLVVAGHIDPDHIVELAQQLCGEWSPGAVDRKRLAPDFVTGRSCKRYQQFSRQELAHVFPAPGGRDPLDETSEVVAAILGGDNSRFYWQIVQKGMAPRAGVWRIDYEDCGLMVLHAECDPQRCAELADAMAAEARHITRDGIREEELQRVKNRKRTALAVESEAPYYRLGQLLDDIDYRGAPRSVEQRLAELDALTPRKISEYLERYPIDRGGHFVSVGPRDWLPDN